MLCVSAWTAGIARSSTIQRYFWIETVYTVLLYVSPAKRSHSRFKNLSVSANARRATFVWYSAIAAPKYWFRAKNTSFRCKLPHVFCLFINHMGWLRMLLGFWTVQLATVIPQPSAQLEPPVRGTDYLTQNKLHGEISTSLGRFEHRPTCALVSKVSGFLSNVYFRHTSFWKPLKFKGALQNAEFRSGLIGLGGGD